MKVKLHKNGWHSKIQSFVLGNRKPTFNSLCPYFWTTVFCIISSPFIAIYKIGKFILSKIFQGIVYAFQKMFDGAAWVLEYCITEPIEKFLIAKTSEKELINYAINFEPSLKRKYTGSTYTYSSVYYDLFQNKTFSSDKQTERLSKWEKYKKLQQEKAAKEGKVWDEKRFLDLLDQKAGQVRMTLEEQEALRNEETRRKNREIRERQQREQLALARRLEEEEIRNREKERIAQQHQEEIRIQAQIKIAKRKKFNNRIIKYAKIVTPVILVIAGAGIIYFLYRMFVLIGSGVISLTKSLGKGIAFIFGEVFSFLTSASTWIGFGKLILFSVALALGTLTIFLIFKYTILGLKKIWPKFKFSVSTIDPSEYLYTKLEKERKSLIDNVYKPIKAQPLKRVKRSFHNFFDFFKDYIKAAKEDYCPEIEWLNDEENNKNVIKNDK